MSYLDWKAGDKVIYIGGDTHRIFRRVFFGLFDVSFNFSRLTKGAEYTIKGIGKARHKLTGEMVVAIDIDPDPSQVPGSYAASCFRKVQKRATSIEVFTALLNPSEDETFRELEAEQFKYEPTEVPFR